MSTFDKPELLDALSAPVGDLITAVGTSVAAAQRALDSASLAALQEIYERDEAQFYLLQSIGYKPTWYQIPEVEAEIAIALTVTGSEEQSGGGQPGVRLYGAPVDAGYKSRFGFELQAASRVRFKVVPVPPSTQAEALRAVPPLVNKSLRQALSLLRVLGIDYVRPEPADLDARVIGQSPHPGAILEQDEVVRIELAIAPNIVGLTVAEARTLLAGQVVDLIVAADAPEHAIIVAQTPAAGGALVIDQVSAEVLRAPDLLGASLAEAQAQLAALGLLLRAGGPFAETAIITGQSPSAGTLMDPGAEVSLASVVPELRGGSVAQARLAIAPFHGRASAPANTPEAALVAEQTPAPGGELLSGQLLLLTPASAPELRGLRFDAARDAVQLLGGSVSVAASASSRAARLAYPADDTLIDSQLPAAGEPLRLGEPVVLTLRLMPSLVGLSFEAAERALSELGGRLEIPQGADPQGVVGGQSVAEGSPLRAEETTSVRQASVPDVVGLPSADAVAAIEALGLVVRLPRGAHPEVHVETQDPSPREPAVVGLEVSVSLYAVPDVRGMGLDRAAAALTAIGMPYTTSTRAPTGEVASQSPDPGRNLTPSAGAVRLTFSGGTLTASTFSASTRTTSAREP